MEYTMGNICGSTKSNRGGLMHELFDLYDTDGGFNLGKEEIINLSKYLHDKEISRLNEQIIGLTIILGKFEDTTPEHYVSGLLKNRDKVGYKDFNNLMDNVRTPELYKLITDAKVAEYQRLQRDLNMV